MLRIIISGCSGRMGQVVSRICDEDDEVRVIAGFDINTEKKLSYPVYAAPIEFGGKANVIIDFSNPGSLSQLLEYAKKTKTPAVLCTTGYTEEQVREIESASESVPIFRSFNMSLGINLLLELVKKACRVLGQSYNIEIVERHHNKKVDAPSGTAIMIAGAAKSALDYEPQYVYDRHSTRAPRSGNEIGMHSVRGGTIVGEHEIIFAGQDEVIELKHSALSRDVFAAGAVSAAKFLNTRKENRIYTMEDLVSGE